MRHEPPESDHCGGHGWFPCYCGGDLCVCANQGEIECDGCDDCLGPDDWDEPAWDDDGPYEPPACVDPAQLALPIDTTAPRGAEETNEHE